MERDQLDKQAAILSRLLTGQQLQFTVRLFRREVQTRSLVFKLRVAEYIMKLEAVLRSATGPE